MQKGIGGASKASALATLTDMTKDPRPVDKAEYTSRIDKAQRYMREHQIAAIYLNAGTNLSYFTGMDWYPSERLVGAILPASGEVVYIAPLFEIDSLSERQVIAGDIVG